MKVTKLTSDVEIIRCLGTDNFFLVIENSSYFAESLNFSRDTLKSIVDKLNALVEQDND
jgi:hypothetical protein